jgi:hypothetical protein
MTSSALTTENTLQRDPINVLVMVTRYVFLECFLPLPLSIPLVLLIVLDGVFLDVLLKFSVNIVVPNNFCALSCLRQSPEE